MKKLFLYATVGVAAIAMAPAAYAAQTITISGPSGTFADDNVTAGTQSVSTTPEVAGNQSGVNPLTPFPIGTAGTFSRIFTFFTPTGFNLTNVTAQNIASSPLTNIDFSSVTLNGVAFAVTNGVLDSAALFNQMLVTGATNTLVVNGSTGGNAALSGNLSFAAVSAVPEPATWAFMLIGFGAVGYSMRKRPAYKLAQAV